MALQLLHSLHKPAAAAASVGRCLLHRCHRPLQQRHRLRRTTSCAIHIHGICPGRVTRLLLAARPRLLLLRLLRPSGLAQHLVVLQLLGHLGRPAHHRVRETRQPATAGGRGRQLFGCLFVCVCVVMWWGKVK